MWMISCAGRHHCNTRTDIVVVLRLGAPPWVKP